MVPAAVLVHFRLRDPPAQRDLRQRRRRWWFGASFLLENLRPAAGAACRTGAISALSVYVAGATTAAEPAAQLDGRLSPSRSTSFRFKKHAVRDRRLASMMLPSLPDHDPRVSWSCSCLGWIDQPRALYRAGRGRRPGCLHDAPVHGQRDPARADRRRAHGRLRASSRIFWRIVLPLCPARRWARWGMITFIASWNNFIGAAGRDAFGRELHRCRSRCAACRARTTPNGAR